MLAAYSSVLHRYALGESTPAVSTGSPSGNTVGTDDGLEVVDQV
jgi:hypothetical protein